MFTSFTVFSVRNAVARTEKVDFTGIKTTSSTSWNARYGGAGATVDDEHRY